MGLTVTSALHWWAREIPDTTAISADGRSISYRDLHRWSKGISHNLKARGVVPGDRIAIYAMNSLEYCALILGAFDAGVIAAPISFRSTTSELREALATVQPKLVFADKPRRDSLPEDSERSSLEILALEAVEGWRGDDQTAALPSAPDAEAPALLTATSGSTAMPKYVTYSQRTPVIFACEMALQEPACAKGARSINVAPFSSGGALVFLKFLVLGHTQYLLSTFDENGVLDLIVNERINVMQVVPIFYERLSRLPRFADADLSSLRFTTVGGAPVSQGLLETWHKKGVILRQLYGQTEAGGAWEARETALSQPEKCGRGSIFTEFSSAPASDLGEASEILIRGPTVMLGYWRNPEATQAALADGWLRTGDLGKIDSGGNLTFVDRIKDIIISGGLNISAAEVERVIAQVDGVEEVAVIGASDPKFGETPLAVVFTTGAVQVADIVNYCNTHLSNFKVPRFVVVEEQPLPRLSSGKIAKAQLREKYRDAGDRLERVR